MNMETQVQSRPPIGETKRKILVVEDEKDIRDLVRYNLEAEGFTVVEASDGEIGLKLASSERPALVVLDLMLPGIAGLEVCRLLRAKDSAGHVPILILTARASEVDKVLGLELGADDYVTKPFSPRELVARVKAVLRRAYGPVVDRPHEVYERGRLRIDYDTYEVTLDGEPVGLGLREFELLKFFVQYPQRVFSRTQILDLVWGQDIYVEPRTVDVHIRRLRQRVEKDDANPTLILTVRGVGYKFSPDALEE
jgi:phosphate regulon transcriptional regulator PhoB